MKAILILLGILVAVGLPLWLLDRRKRNAAGEDSESTTGTTQAQVQEVCSDDCCTTHEVCPSQELLSGLCDPAAYYDDEYLDAFAGRAAGDYNEDEIEQFRDVLYTLIPEDRMGWYKSLKKRGITMPSSIHAEFLMLVNE